jgi:nitrous oxide reductase accessory protein NosL
MKRFLFFLSLCFIFSSSTLFAQNAVEAPKSCELCGMDRTYFAHSRMLIVYADGSSIGTCSLHCAAADLKKNGGKKVKTLQVADLNSKKLIDARKATWVTGGKKSGVMTNVAKWAFAKKTDAEQFVKAQGGKIASFEEALALAQAE